MDQLDILQDALRNVNAYANLRLHPVGPPAIPIANQQAADIAERLLQGVAPDGDRLLHIAARLEDVALVRAIYDNHRWRAVFYVALKNKREETALHCAAATGNVAMIALLIQLAELEDNGRKLLRDQNDNGETCLHEAIRSGKSEAVVTLVNEDMMVVLGPNVDGRALVKILDKQGVSPLYLATTSRQLEVVEFLTREQESAGTYPAASYDGPGNKTALHAAVLLSKGSYIYTCTVLLPKFGSLWHY
jgi:hypothetical protein